ncbi:MAG: S-layer homology domain-containing protein [Andreesenia angusta]|nr:S-layer homology domain-containing protein [Andreesenia angusta]
MKRFISITLFIISIALSSTSLSYNDIDNHWAKEYINTMSSLEVLGQFEDVNLYPEQYMNRAECAELISDFFEKHYGYRPDYSGLKNKFPDLLVGTRNTKKIEALSNLFYFTSYTAPGDTFPTGVKKNNIINGYPDGNFHPYNYVTRAEFAKMLITALDCFGYLDIRHFPEFHSDMNYDGNTHWGAYYIGIAYGEKIMNGYSQNMMSDGLLYIEFRPDGMIKRAEAIKMVATAMNRIFYDKANIRYTWDDHLYQVEGEQVPEWHNFYPLDSNADNFTKSIVAARLFFEKTVLPANPQWIDYNEHIWIEDKLNTYGNVVTLYYDGDNPLGNKLFRFIRYKDTTDIICFRDYDVYPHSPSMRYKIDNNSYKIINP